MMEKRKNEKLGKEYEKKDKEESEETDPEKDEGRRQTLAGAEMTHCG